MGKGCGNCDTIISMSKQFIIIIEGPMGSGKTTIAKILHPQLPRTVILGIDKIKWFLSDFQRTPDDNELMSDALIAMAKVFLTAKCNLLVAQGFWKKEFVQKYSDLAKEFNLDVYFYQLTAPEEVLRQRIKERPVISGRPVLTQERIDRNLNTWKENKYEMGTEIDTIKYSPEEVVEIILSDINSKLGDRVR